MDTQIKASNNERVNLELVLEELTNEQKSQTKSINELVIAVNSLSGDITNFKEEIRKPNPTFVSTDKQSIQEMVRKEITDIKLIIATQVQKPILKKYQLQLFPEQDAKIFYKIVFGRWFLWLIIMLFLTNSYKFAIHMSDNQREIKLKILENDRFVKSWNKMYLKSSNRIKKIMDSAYFNSVEH
jgi:hypothetical protein